jgi:hypothetical protein
VREEEAHEWVPDLAGAGLSAKEAVAASAGILHEPVPFGDRLDVVAENSAGIADLLGEAVPPVEPVSIRPEDQRMPAAHTGILVHAVARRNPRVGVMAQKAGERVADVGRRAVLRQVSNPAAAVPYRLACPEDLVVDDVPPDRAAESCPHAP